MIYTTLRAVMICHYSVMDKKMTAILYQNYSHFLVGVTVILEVREVFILKTESHRGELPVFRWNTTGSHRQSLTKKAPQKKSCGAFLVGVTGFEPAASWSRTKRSTKLSHTPMLQRRQAILPSFFKTCYIISPRGEKVNSFSEKMKNRRATGALGASRGHSARR